MIKYYIIEKQSKYIRNFKFIPSYRLDLCKCNNVVDLNIMEGYIFLIPLKRERERESPLKEPHTLRSCLECLSKSDKKKGSNEIVSPE